MKDLPVGWQALPIGALAAPRLGGNYKNGDTPSQRPLIKMGNIARVDIDLERVAYIPDSEHVDESHRLRYGDVLFNTRNTLDLVGKVSIWRNEVPRAYYNSNILRLEFFPQHCGDSRYFGYALNTKRAVDDIRALATGTTSVAAVYTRDLLKLTIPVPSRAEQQAIATALDDADALISSIERMLTKKQAIKQGIAQELLMARKRLGGFSGAWQTRRLSELLSYEQPTPYLVSNTDYVGSGTPVLTAGKTFVLGHTADQHGIYRAVPVIIFDDFTTASKLVTFPFKAKSSAMKMLRARPRTNLRFVYERMQLINFQAVDHKRRWISEYGKLEVAVPDEPEQTAIADALADADAEIAALVRRLKKARAIKGGMAQQLLTGRIRLPEVEAVA